MKKIGMLHLADSRDDFFVKREPLILEEVRKLMWISEEYNIVESEIIHSDEGLNLEINKFISMGVTALIIHLPIWADPIFTVRAAALIDGPILLIGNSREETSSLVAMLGSGGALNQIGRDHIRVFDHATEEGTGDIKSFIRGINTVQNMKGMTMGTFGSRGLGIFTTIADPAQVMKIFGIDIQYFDEEMIIKKAEAMNPSDAEDLCTWVSDQSNSINLEGPFTKNAFLRQARSYLATEALAKEHGLDILCVKCQQALSDGYATQCLSHMLMNSTIDHKGGKAPMVHSCESDIDGAITMQILKELSGGQATSLLDIRSIKPEKGMIILANCGSTAIDFFSDEGEKPLTGLEKIDVMPHVFGKAGGGAYSGVFSSGPITLARLIRIDRRYKMYVIQGEIEDAMEGELALITKEFPKALIKANITKDFLDGFGANHIHGIKGDYHREIKMFCKLVEIECEVWR